MSWNKSEDAILTEVNHNQMNKGNKIQNMNALPQTNLKEKPLDLLSALPKLMKWHQLFPKRRKKIACLLAEM